MAWMIIGRIAFVGLANAKDDKASNRAEGE
jgi:hypothetical protein